MAKQKTKKQSNSGSDSAFILKIVLYFILGSIWLRIQTDSSQIGLPLGLALGIYFASHDHFMIDRKLEYVVLLCAAALSFFLPTGFILLI